MIPYLTPFGRLIVALVTLGGAGEAQAKAAEPADPSPCDSFNPSAPPRLCAILFGALSTVGYVGLKFSKALPGCVSASGLLAFPAIGCGLGLVAGGIIDWAALRYQQRVCP